MAKKLFDCQQKLDAALKENRVLEETFKVASCLHILPTFNRGDELSLGNLWIQTVCRKLWIVPGRQGWNKWRSECRIECWKVKRAADQSVWDGTKIVSMSSEAWKSGDGEKLVGCRAAEAHTRTPNRWDYHYQSQRASQSEVAPHPTKSVLNIWVTDQAKNTRLQELELKIREEKERFENSFSSLKQLKRNHETTTAALTETKESFMLLQKQSGQ